MDVSKCSQCDCGRKRPIVNKHFYLCQQKNEQRLNNTNSRLVKRNSRPERTLRSSVSIKRFRDKSLQVSSRKIRRVSAKSRYITSSGEVVSQIEINRRYKETCEQIDQERDLICEGLGRYGLPLSHSHTISRKRCKELGKVELIWDKGNIFLESYHEPSSKPYYAHNIWESGSLEQKKTLLNFTRKLEYIKKHDPELYQRLV